MRRFSDLSIKRKLTYIIMGTTMAALVLACSCFFVYEFLTVPRTIAQNVASLAQVTSNSVAAAITFRDQSAATETLGALRATPSVSWALLYTNDGEVFATFDRDGSGKSPPQCSKVLDGYQVREGRVELCRRILLRDKAVGVIGLSADMSEIQDRLLSYGQIVAFVLVISLFVAYLISLRLQQFISMPVLQLASLAREVSLKRNYSLRATKLASDEIGVMVEGFNAMLAQIEGRDRELQAARKELEERVVELQREVAERQRAEAGLAKQTLELQRSNAELEQFAYVASHDLQEPLRMVSSYTQLLAKRYKAKLDGDALEFIGFAVDGVKRMQTLIRDLLEFSRVGTRGKEFVPVSSEDVVQLACSNLSGAIKERGAEVSVAPLPIVLADQGQLVQLFQNLIGNAIKYCDGAIPQVHLSCEVTDGRCQFSVKDNGIGIAPEFAERIFILFQRLHGKGEYEGTGIGLAICKKIVERHGGRIWVESAAGQGSNFKFTLPLAVEPKLAIEACL